MEKEPKLARDNARQLMEWLAAGTIKPHVSARFPLERGVEALREVAERRAKGKVLVLP
jgi:NADPH2:quinone reductase